MAHSLILWRERYSETLYRCYASVIFAVYIAVLLAAWSRGEFVLHLASDGLRLGAWFAFALFIWLEGFYTPRGAYVSLDRITQVGMVLIFSAADASAVNGLSAFVFPLIRLRSKYGWDGALFRSMHNAAMFGLMIYLAGHAYYAAGGPAVVDSLNMQVAIAFVVLVFCMQVLNSAFLHVRSMVNGIYRSWSVDWFSHSLEIPVSLIGLLMALVVSRMDAASNALFFGLLIALVTTVKILNNASLALQESRDLLEVKVSDRVADIERQAVALNEVNRALAEANRAQEKLVCSLQATSEELERQTREDGLTGLYNRRHMDYFLDRENERAERFNLSLVVALIDIDHFKAVNDTFSHQVGDEVLKALAGILVENVRALDLVARYGGEEILLCMPDTTLADAMIVCERARRAIVDHDWNGLAPGLRVTASFGLAQAERGGNVADLLRASDAKLYEAKHGGRNQLRA